ncbi:uncharacterized protein LOC111373858 isoform X2 [Olea europaea var. sylvestris]|nr:uncharacterized protein LOC111373858 isoform X2 [Olea europaea var. sylvestris]
MGRKQGDKGKKNGKAPLCKDEDIKAGHLNSIFGKYSEAEMLSQLNILALDPCKQKISLDKIQPLCDQILRLRKVMVPTNSEIPWRKRKLQEFLKDELRTTPGNVVPKQNGMKLSRWQSPHASSVPCLLSSVHPTETFDKKIHPLTPENQTPNEATSLNLYVATHISDSVTLDKPDKKKLQPPFKSFRLPSFICDHLQKKVVPVGPRFQADVHEWNGQVEKSLLIGVFKNDFRNSRWLGTKVWPIEVGTVLTRGRMNEKGRPAPCRCVTPRSVDCIRRHILERRQLLQRDLGPAFFQWKFNEMGEQVSKLWTSKERQRFKSLVKMKPQSNGKNFLRQASKYFPTKSKETIISYYFNVIILQCLSIQTRSPLEQVDSDDDEVVDINSMGLQKQCKGKKAIKTRYLRVAS